MMRQASVLVATCALLRPSIAMLEPSSMVTSVLSTVEQYCFPKSNAPFLSSGLWPSMIMIYSGTTLTESPTLLTLTGNVPTATASTGSKTHSQIGQSADTSSLQSAVSGSGQSSLPASMGGGLFLSSFLSGSQSGPPTDSTVISTPYSTTAAGSDPVVTSGPVAGDPDSNTASGMTSVFSSTSSEASGGTTESERSVLSSSFPTQSTASESQAFSEGASVVATSIKTLPGVTGTDSGRPPIRSPTGSTAEPSPKPNGDGSSISSSAALPATSGLPADLSDSRNRTLELSPNAVDALSLAQFLKHLGVSMFDASRWEVMSGAQSSASATALKAIVANISVVSQSGKCDRRDPDS